MTIESILDMLRKNNLSVKRLIVRDRFAINLDLSVSMATPSVLNQLKTPFYIEDNRLVRLLAGRLRFELNFMEYELEAGDVLLIRENSYFEIKDVSDDARAEALLVVPEKCHTDFEYVGVNYLVVHPDPDEWGRLSRLIYQIYEFSCMEPYMKTVVEPLVAALVNYTVSISQKAGSGHALSRGEQIFNRFIELLNNADDGKYTVGHYAGKLCMTPQYLSKVVSQVSGRTVSDYINRAVVMKTKILLHDKGKTISEIADAMHFTSDTSFCRFFKRETGQTPSEYRRTIPDASPERAGNIGLNF